MGTHVYLSPPDITDDEKSLVMDALDSGWAAPLGPHVDAFEEEIAAFVGVDHAVALSSGTAALHLGLLALGVGPDDDVIVPTLTFGGTAFAVTYTGARPVFIDAERTSWNIDPDLVDGYLSSAARRGRLPAAIIPVDLFGRPADYDRLLPICSEFGVPVLIDAAGSLGAEHNCGAAGSMGRAGVFSFNGNKIMTTSGGGMFVTDDRALADRVRHLATQAREPVPWYEHTDIGYSYRLSNVLAALGRGQLRRLPEIIERRRETREHYAQSLDGMADVVGDPPWGRANAWLTGALINHRVQVSPTEFAAVLATHQFEARHIWKPMHLQPVFRGAPLIGGGVAEKLFERGLCLPSGQRLTAESVDRVARIVREAAMKAGASPTGDQAEGILV